MFQVSGVEDLLGHIQEDGGDPSKHPALIGVLLSHAGDGLEELIQEDHLGLLLFSGEQIAEYSQLIVGLARRLALAGLDALTSELVQSLVRTSIARIIEQQASPQVLKCVFWTIDQSKKSLKSHIYEDVCKTQFAKLTALGTNGVDDEVFDA
jgi:hypothetical protein